MKNLEIFENYSREKKVTLTSRQNRDILVVVLGGKIQSIDNKSGVRFPFSVGQTFNRNIETWACNNGFKIDGKSPCPEEKIFGIRKSLIPKGHELRMLYPHKFKD